MIGRSVQHRTNNSKLKGGNYGKEKSNRIVIDDRSIGICTVGISAYHNIRYAAGSNGNIKFLSKLILSVGGRKKVTALLLMIVVSVSALWGCGNSASDQAEPSNIMIGIVATIIVAYFTDSLIWSEPFTRSMDNSLV